MSTLYCFIGRTESDMNLCMQLCNHIDISEMPELKIMYGGQQVVRTLADEVFSIVGRDPLIEVCHFGIILLMLGFSHYFELICLHVMSLISMLGHYNAIYTNW